MRLHPSWDFQVATPPSFTELLHTMAAEAASNPKLQPPSATPSTASLAVVPLLPQKATPTAQLPPAQGTFLVLKLHLLYHMRSILSFSLSNLSFFKLLPTTACHSHNPCTRCSLRAKPVQNGLSFLFLFSHQRLLNFSLTCIRTYTSTA